MALVWFPDEILIMGAIASLWTVSYKRPELAPLSSALSGAGVAFLVTQCPIVAATKDDGSKCCGIFDLDLEDECERKQSQLRARNVALSAVVGVGLGLAYRSYRRR